MAFAQAIALNPAAREEFLDRLSDAMTGTLSDDRVLALIEEFEAALSPEISRERQRWGGDAATWQADVDRLKASLTRYDHTALLVESLRQHLALTDAEVAGLMGG